MYLSKSPRSDVLSLAKNGRVVVRCYMEESAKGDITGCFLPTVFHISPSRFKIPDPRKLSLISVSYIVMGESTGIVTVFLSGYPHERSLCDQSPTRT